MKAQTMTKNISKLDVPPKTEYTKEEWIAEAQRRFGDNYEDYRFVCPSCGRTNSGREFKEAGASPDDMYNCCIGRFDKTKGCDWAAWGLFDICTVHVDGQPVFGFGEVEDEA